VLPGVGSFRSAAKYLKESGLLEAIVEHAHSGKPLLGICLGAQLLFEYGEEGGMSSGLGLLQGSVRPLASIVTGVRLPHTGWNWVAFAPGSSRATYPEDGYYYFNHAFFAEPRDPHDVAGWAEYGVGLPVAFERGNVVGYQFHPEKSQELGLSSLQAFLDLR